MARNNTDDPGRRSDLPKAVRRSARVRKQHAGTGNAPESDRAAGLVEAARVLSQSNASGTKRSPKKKHVAFDERQPEVVEPVDVSDQEQQHDRPHKHSHRNHHRHQHDDGRKWSTADPFNADPDRNDASVTAVRPRSLDLSAATQPPAVKSTLSPTRAARLRDLIEREGSTPRQNTGAGTKRPLDNNDDNHHHHDRHHLHIRRHHHDPDQDHDHDHDRWRPDEDTLRHRAKRNRDAKLLDRPQIYNLPADPVEHMLSEMGRHPHHLSLTHIAQMFKIIQDRIYRSEGDLATNPGFVEKYFNFTLTDRQRQAWPLHELRTNYIPLYMTTRYIADGSQHGWHNFFTAAETRQPLVAGIIGEWLVQRVFKHTAFGFPRHLVDELEDLDREYLHYDAVVRSKVRARKMGQWYSDDTVWPVILDSTILAVDGLAEELLTVLHPLLPPPLFDPLDPSTTDTTNPGSTSSSTRRDSLSHRQENARRTLRSSIKNDLFNLIMDSASLHKGIRLTGENGTIVRLCPAPQKGSLFQPTGPVQCVNGLQCNSTTPADPNDPSDLRIKMTTFPRVEAVVPHGPDMAELAFAEVGYREKLSLKVPVANHALHRDRRRSSSNTAAAAAPEDQTPDFTWDDKDELWPIVPDALQDNEGRNPGVVDPDTGEVNTVKRAAYVAVYPSLADARVYCEWTPPAPSSSSDSPGNLTLEDAVALARANHPDHLLLRIEDAAIFIWNVYSLYGGIAQWGILATVIVVAVCKAFGLPQHATHAVETLVREGGKRFRAASRFATTVPLEEIPRAVLQSLTEGLRGWSTRAGPFYHAFKRPVGILVDGVKRRSWVRVHFGHTTRTAHVFGPGRTSWVDDTRAAAAADAITAAAAAGAMSLPRDVPAGRVTDVPDLGRDMERHMRAWMRVWERFGRG